MGNKIKYAPSDLEMLQEENKKPPQSPTRITIRLNFKKMSIGHHCYGKREGVSEKERERLKLASSKISHCSFTDDSFF